MKPDNINQPSLDVLTMITIIVLLLAIIVGLQALELYLQMKRVKNRAEAAGGKVPVRKTTWLDLFRREGIQHDKFIEGHEYDGIREYDNSPPAWFNWLFYGSIFFAFCYLMYYHVLKIGDLQAAEYEKAVKEAAPILAKVQERAIYLADQPRLVDEENLAKGAAIFKANCITCHGQHGEGIVGPNLTDEYWLHGGHYN